MRKSNLNPFILFIFNIIENFFLKVCPIIYMGLTRAQDSHDRFIFGSDIIKLNKNSDNLNILDVGCGSGNFYTTLVGYLRSL